MRCKNCPYKGTDECIGCPDNLKDELSGLRLFRIDFPEDEEKEKIKKERGKTWKF